MTRHNGYRESRNFDDVPVLRRVNTSNPERQYPDPRPAGKLQHRTHLLADAQGRESDPNRWECPRCGWVLTCTGDTVDSLPARMYEHTANGEPCKKEEAGK